MSTPALRDVAAWAVDLDVSEEALTRLGCTVDERGNLRWPERDADGSIIGLTTRYLDGRKKADAGSRRGLCYASPFPAYAGSSREEPILLPEGLSDTATAIDVGYDAIGRPSATGGNTLLVPLVSGRHVVIGGENDSGAGKTGAEKCARELHSHTASVRIVYPPSEYKDLRAWVAAVGLEAVRLALATVIDDAPRWTPEEASKAGTRGDDETALPERWIPRRLAEVQNEEPPTFILPGIVAAGHITSVSAKPKVGKTEWVQGLIRAMGNGGSFMGLPVETGRVLIVSEESPGLWLKRNAERPIGNHVSFIFRPFTSRPSPAEWEIFCRHLARIAARESIALVVIDTFSKVSPVENENDAAQVSGAMMALTPIVETGAALLLSHHERKSGGDEGDAIRGSGAFGASVDVLAELRRSNPKDRRDSRRTLTVTGRFSECPAETVVIELGADGHYSTIGNRQQARNRDRWALLNPILPDAAPGLTDDELLARWPEDDKPGTRTLMTTLRAKQDSGHVGVSGKGVKGDPFRFYRRLPEIRANAHPLAFQSARMESEGVDSQHGIRFAQSKLPSRPLRNR